jgi:CubicO group peptidase (beta-lactamase class C family)
MLRGLSFLFLFIWFGTLHAQFKIHGLVINKKSKEAISYANIGIRYVSIGTLSNADGSFELIIPEKYSNDTLYFSSLGFAPKNISIKWLIQQPQPITIFLSERSVLLEGITITEKALKNKIVELGNNRCRGGTLETDTTYAGASEALLIDNKTQKQIEYPMYLQRARLKIFRNNLDSFKIRIRVLDVDTTTGKPGTDLLHHDVIVESTIRKGWLAFDLSHLQLKIERPFFIVFERILTSRDRMLIAEGYRMFKKQYPSKVKIDTIEFEGKPLIRERFTGGGIDLPGTFIGISTTENAREKFSSYSRNTSFGEWEKVRGTLTATVSLSNQPLNDSDKGVVSSPDCQEKTIACTVQNICTDFLDESGLTGMQLRVSVKGKTVFSANLGYSNSDLFTPVNDSTLFRINSISKSLTSAALIKLAGDGKLDLDAPIKKYLPDFPEKEFPITTRQLSGHLGGIRDYHQDNLSDLVRTKHYLSTIDALEVFQFDSLTAKPGSKFHYSTFGWNIIGAVIEVVSGMNYLDYMKSSIWHHLKMKNTCGDDITKTIYNRSKFYDALGDENDFGDISYKYPGGGLLSTTTDLVTFGNELLYGQFFDELLKAELFKTQYTENGEATNYGMGWYTGLDTNGHRIWYHSGDQLSSSSHLYIYPDDGIVIALLANGQEAAAFDVEEIGELFYSK